MFGQHSAGIRGMLKVNQPSFCGTAFITENITLHAPYGPGGTGGLG